MQKRFNQSVILTELRTHVWQGSSREKSESFKTGRKTRAKFFRNLKDSNKTVKKSKSSLFRGPQFYNSNKVGVAAYGGELFQSALFIEIKSKSQIW